MSYSTRQEEEKEIKTECPCCKKPINQNRRYSNDRVQTSCGEDRCRQFVYRLNKAERIEKERKSAEIDIRQYCAQHLSPALSQALLHITALLMQMDREHGHLQARQIIEAIEWKRCKHDKITTLEENAVAARRRAEKAEEYNKELETLYERRIAELEEEVRIYQSLESHIHGISLRQLEQQPEESEE